MDILTLNLLLQDKMSILAQVQHFQYEGKILVNDLNMLKYKIAQDYVIILNAGLCGGSGCGGNLSPAKLSYKEMAQKSNGSALISQAYIVDKANQTPRLELIDPFITGIHEAYSTKVIICRFNDLWPKTVDMFKWIYSNWTNDCEISLCSKGFFVVMFKCQENYQGVLDLGPWF